MNDGLNIPPPTEQTVLEFQELQDEYRSRVTSQNPYIARLRELEFRLAALTASPETDDRVIQYIQTEIADCKRILNQ